MSRRFDAIARRVLRMDPAEARRDLAARAVVVGIELETARIRAGRASIACRLGLTGSEALRSITDWRDMDWRDRTDGWSSPRSF